MSQSSKQILWVASWFLLISNATRLGLSLFSGEPYMVGEWTRIFVIGLIFDITVLPWLLLPWALYSAILPDPGKHSQVQKLENIWRMIWGALYLSFFVVIGVAEFTFWAEFASRFDFIAVDYLVYTHEVMGNIRESYPVALWLLVISGSCLTVTWLTWPGAVDSLRSSRSFQWKSVLTIGLIGAMGAMFVNLDIAKISSNVYVQQLSGNGIYALFSAYHNNELEYDKYYPTKNTADLNENIRDLVKQTNSTFVSADGIERHVSAYGPQKNANVILVSIESLSADYLGVFGNTLGITPELDKLAKQGLLFTNIFATGTRTVRGLEALSIGTPPTPGQSIVRRPKNNGLENLGEELNENGWKPYWIYGGYGFFDNMNAYFGANEYTVVDRTDVEEEGLTVHGENIWGIADEDLYTLAMIKMDREFAKGNRFFAHVMTTSNHRPYTFPENRIDLPQNYREGAVKYTDWAIGDFIRRSSTKPWFDNTLFIFVSDHTAKAAGKTDLPVWRYHIPMIWYAPKLMNPGIMERLMSQVDVGPSLLGWLGVNYQSRFFGYDIFNLEPGRERAFISTYQKLGYLKGGRTVVLDVNKAPEVISGLAIESDAPKQPNDSLLISEAIAWYQSASQYFSSGYLKDFPDEDD